jgi:hypothetical protein
MSTLRDVYDLGKETSNKYIGSTNETVVNKAETAKKSLGDILFVLIFDWRILFFTLLTIILSLAYGLKMVQDFLRNNNVYNEYGLAAFSFFSHIFILNAFIAMFTICYYFYKRGHIGRKGPPGPIGPKGPQGKSPTCDICSLKIKTMTRDELEDTENNYNIDNTLYNELSRNAPKTWKSEDINRKLGEAGECSNCKNTKLSNVSYVKGIIGNISEKGILTSFQYLYDKAGKTKLLGGKNGIVGNVELKNNVQKIKCPKNSGIFRIETGYNNAKKGISGVKIYCRDLETGEVKMPEIDTIGEIQQQDQTSMGLCQRQLSFIGGLEINATKDKVSQILIKKCNYKD